LIFVTSIYLEQQQTTPSKRNTSEKQAFFNFLTQKIGLVFFYTNSAPLHVSVRGRITKDGCLNRPDGWQLLAVFTLKKENSHLSCGSSFRTLLGPSYKIPCNADLTQKVLLCSLVVSSLHGWCALCMRSAHLLSAAKLSTRSKLYILSHPIHFSFPFCYDLICHGACLH
jgi:hypothetical protein